MKAFYHPDYFLPLPEGHPFPMEKFPGAYGILASESLEIEVLPVQPATREQLERVHTSAYLDAIAQGELTGYERRRLGLPHYPRLLTRSAQETAGSIAAAYAALEDGIACNLAGGTHHAFADRGLGFCVLNDVAIAIAELRSKHPDLWILVVDTDAHQGNGTHALLRDVPNTYTYSIHVGRNYPSAKEPGDCDVPLPRYVTGDEYLHELHRTLEPCFRETEPDLVFWVAGADN
ncbi:MAG: histone deacetylase, partial [Verrucomicrobiota bacterium]